MSKDKNKIAIETYDVIAKKYAQRYYDDIDQELPYIDEFLSHIPNEGMILDIGCGPGNYTAYMYKHGYKVVGIDLSKEMLGIAREKNPTLSFKKVNMRRIKFPDESFHGLLCTYSLIHIPTSEIVQVLKSFSRILMPRGCLLLIVQAGEPDKIIDEPMQAGRKMFFNFFTIERVTELLQKAGFIIVWQKSIPNNDSDTETLSSEIIIILASKT